MMPHGTLSRAAVISTLRAAGCVFAEDEADLLIEAATSSSRLTELVDRRVAGTPLEYILGWAEFAGLRIEVDAGVFVPRKRTEYMVQIAVELAGPDAVVLDLCCGSGAIGAAVLDALPTVDLYAADIDPVAVRCARRNIQHFRRSEELDRIFEGDLFDALPKRLERRIDIIAANTPYVPTDSIAMMPPEARIHEARVALDGGGDGLDVQRRVAKEAREWLAPGGSLLVEVSEEQAPQTARIFERSGLVANIHHSSELYSTVVSGTAVCTKPPSLRSLRTG